MAASSDRRPLSVQIMASQAMLAVFVLQESLLDGRLGGRFYWLMYSSNVKLNIEEERPTCCGGRASSLKGAVPKWCTDHKDSSF